MRLLWLPDVLRAAGLTVHTYSGWEDRGSEVWGEDNTNPSFRFPLQGIVCHATAGSRSSTDAGEMRVLWETGSTSAPVPISQLYLSRSGAWWVGASGRCNHVLVGAQGPLQGYGNYQLIGVEAQNDNRGEPWSAQMLASYQRGVAAICRHMGWTADRVVAHWEHQADKSDPKGIDMNAFRAAVATGGNMAPNTPALSVTLDGTTARLVWDTPADNGQPINRVIVRVHDNPMPQWPLTVIGNVLDFEGDWGTAYNLEGLKPGQAYYAQVYARNDTGWSTPGSATFVTPAPASGGGDAEAIADVVVSKLTAWVRR